MKLIKWIGHPVIMMVLYLLLVIEGDQFGGFFMLYLLLAIPHLVPYSLIAVGGLFFMILAFNYRGSKLATAIFYLIGFVLMISSLFIFFSKGNKWETFSPGIPLYSFMLFGICSICFLIWLMSFFQNSLFKSNRVLS